MSRRLCVLDVDSTLITSEVIELLADRAGKRDEVAAITESAMRGEIDFAESLARRVATLAGLPITVCDDALAIVRFTPGAHNLVETLHGRGWVVGLVSGGFVEFVGPLAARLGITRYRANGLESVDGILTGRTYGPVIDRAAKARALIEFAEAEDIEIGDTVAIGGGANDLDMMVAAGLGIAFNAKPVVQEQADTAITSTRLDAVLEVLETWKG
jgi:phosphoserine phosphatase